MKSVKQLLILLVIGAVIFIVTGCATYPKIIEHKGSALGMGIKEVPEWVDLSNRGTTGVMETRPEFKNVYIIIANGIEQQLQPALTWINNFDAQQQIASYIETRAASVFKAHEDKLPDAANSERAYRNAINTVVSARYTGARKEGDWWVKTQDKDGSIKYQVYVIYTIEKASLNNQIVNQIKRIKDSDSALSEYVDAICAELLARGLD